MNDHLQKTITAIKEKKDFKFDQTGPRVKINESVGRAAFYYEKLRNAIEYHDEHLFLKNAIKRILKRRTYLGAQGNGLALLKELVWAKYFENETLPMSLAEEIESILRKYTFFKDNVHIGISRTSATDLFIGFAACEIEELLTPATDKEEYLAFAKDIFKKNILLDGELDQSLVDIQIEISIRKSIIKEDQEQLRYKLLTCYCPSWPQIPKNEGTDFTDKFASYYEQIEEQLKFNKNSKINKYIKKNSPTLNVIYESIYKGASSFERNVNNPEGFNALIRSEINRKSDNIKSKVMRAVVRGIVFILLTKITLAFLIEIPYELSIYKAINYPALITNITLPPFLMMVIGLLIKVPGKKNTEEMVKLARSVIFDNQLKVKTLDTLIAHKESRLSAFNFIYSLTSITVLALVVWLLITLKFNLASIVLFYIFVSLVSFLGFRIRSTAKEIEVRSEDDSIVTGLYNFVLLPFVVIGKFLSDRWSDYNVTLFFWDFIIEAPFKAIIGLFEAWLAFSREKREEFE